MIDSSPLTEHVPDASQQRSAAERGTSRGPSNFQPEGHSVGDVTATEKRRLPGGSLRLWAIALLGLVIVVGAWLVLKDDDDDEPARAGAKALSVEELQDLAGSRELPMFWAGPQSGLRYEVTETSDGAVYVRYLPEGTEVGDPRPGYLTVATYPLENGYENVVAASRRDDTESERLPNGGLAVISSARPSSVYLAHRGEKYQVEVYHPSPERARDLVLSGAVQPVR
jgi:hypothetical protein